MARPDTLMRTLGQESPLGARGQPGWKAPVTRTRSDGFGRRAPR